MCVLAGEMDAREMMELSKELTDSLLILSSVRDLNQIYSWAFFSDISDHDVIILEWTEELDFPKRSFKFNSIWLEEVEFQNLVKQ